MQWEWISCLCICIFFFFKQKTAYEIYQCDWSSDVCSSDLHRWNFDDWDCLAGAVAAGHILECGTQATGGNFSFFNEIPGLAHPGFPIAEVAEDGSSVITKHENTGGAVTVETVTAQILYEIAEPTYLTPDVVAHFNTIKLDQVGENRVQVTGVEGSQAPRDLKAAINYLGGYRNSMTLVLVGIDAEKKAALVEDTLCTVLTGEREPDLLTFAYSGTGLRSEEQTSELQSH